MQRELEGVQKLVADTRTRRKKQESECDALRKELRLTKELLASESK